MGAALIPDPALKCRAKHNVVEIRGWLNPFILYA